MSYDRALGFVLGCEAGLETADGYKTLAGVRDDKYNDARKGWGLPPRDVEQITVVEMRRFYCEKYWEAMRCDDQPAVIALVLFDSAVQHGPETATKMLQRIVGAAVDGELGPNTMNSLKAFLVTEGIAAFVSDYLEARESLYRALADAPERKQFLDGWLSRLNRLEAEVTAFETAP